MGHRCSGRRLEAVDGEVGVVLGRRRPKRPPRLGHPVGQRERDAAEHREPRLRGDDVVGQGEPGHRHAAATRVVFPNPPGAASTVMRRRVSAHRSVSGGPVAVAGGEFRDGDPVAEHPARHGWSRNRGSAGPLRGAQGGMAAGTAPRGGSGSRRSACRCRRRRPRGRVARSAVGDGSANHCAVGKSTIVWKNKRFRPISSSTNRSRIGTLYSR